MKGKLLLLSSMLSLGFITSCGGGDKLTITFSGDTAFSYVGDERKATFSLPFKLSRELKNGEKMDVVRVSDWHLHNAYNSSSTFTVNGTSLTLTGTVNLDDSHASGFCSYTYAVNVLKSDDSVLSQLYTPEITFNISQKTVYIDDSALEDYLIKKGFDYYTVTPEVNKDMRSLNVYYVQGVPSASVSANISLLKNEDVIEDFGKIEIDPAKGSSLLGTIDEDNWDKKLENGDVLTIKVVDPE